MMYIDDQLLQQRPPSPVNSPRRVVVDVLTSGPRLSSVDHHLVYAYFMPIMWLGECVTQCIGNDNTAASQAIITESVLSLTEIWRKTLAAIRQRVEASTQAFRQYLSTYALKMFQTGDETRKSQQQQQAFEQLCDSMYHDVRRRKEAEEMWSWGWANARQAVEYIIACRRPYQTDVVIFRPAASPFRNTAAASAAAAPAAESEPGSGIIREQQQQ
jgi:hypothetical protein